MVFLKYLLCFPNSYIGEHSITMWSINAQNLDTSFPLVWTFSTLVPAFISSNVENLTWIPQHHHLHHHVDFFILYPVQSVSLNATKNVPQTFTKCIRIQTVLIIRDSLHISFLTLKAHSKVWDNFWKQKPP